MRTFKNYLLLPNLNVSKVNTNKYFSPNVQNDESGFAEVFEMGAFIEITNIAWLQWFLRQECVHY